MGRLLGVARKIVCTFFLSIVVLSMFPACSSDTTGNSPPVAEAGEGYKVMVGTQTTLDGSSSLDDDSDPLTYVWVITQKPELSLAALDDATLATPTFTADLEGEYVIELIVNDGFEDSHPDSVTITTGVDWSLENHSGENLTDEDLSLGVFFQANLSDTTLTGANFSFSDMRGANLTDATIVNTNFVYPPDYVCGEPLAQMMTGVDLTDADLTGSLISGGMGDFCIREDETFHFIGYSLDGAKMVSVNLSDATLNSVTFRGANLHGADMDPVIIGRSNFDGADLTLATIHLTWGSAYAPGSFKNATMVSASVTGWWWLPNFENADLTDANVDIDHDYDGGVNFASATLDGATVTAIRYDYIDLTGAVMTDCLLSGEVIDCDFTNADMTGADISGLIVSGTVTWSNTICPDGTNSDANGGTCVGHL